MKYLQIALLLTTTATAGCSTFIDGLRRDIDDQPDESIHATTGGIWADRGMLDDYNGEDFRRGGRGPASDGGNPRGRRSWVSPEQEEANDRAGVRSSDEPASDDSFSRSPNVPPPVKRKYRNGGRATRSDFMDEGTPEGSLWASDGQTNYYFTKNKVRGVGDIVTINVEPELFRDVKTEMTRSLTGHEREIELNLAQDRMRRKVLGLDGGENKDQVGSAAAAPERGVAASDGKKKTIEDLEAMVPKATYADIDVGKSLEIKEKDTVMAEIIERYPNGNYKIRGTKRVRYRNGFRQLNVLGVVRGQDIAEDDTLASSKLYEYRVEVMK